MSVKDLYEAALAVEQWWLEEGMHKFLGAPVCIFQLRAALANNPLHRDPLPSAAEYEAIQAAKIQMQKANKGETDEQ